MQSFSDATMINQASRPHLFHATTKNKHTLAAGAFVLYMVAYYATTPMTTFDVLFVCGTLILRIAGVFLIACLTSHILTAGAIVFLRITRGWSQEL